MFINCAKIIACKCALSISATGCLCKDVHVVIQDSIFQGVTGLTDLDKLYLALVELDKENHFNTLCFGLGVNSLEKLADFSLKSETQLITSQTLTDIKREIDSKHFNFHELAQVCLHLLSPYSSITCPLFELDLHSCVFQYRLNLALVIVNPHYPVRMFLFGKVL